MTTSVVSEVRQAKAPFLLTVSMMPPCSEPGVFPCWAEHSPGADAVNDYIQWMFLFVQAK
jgi:hypothetical protein